MKYNIKEIQEIIKKEIDIHITNNEFKNNSVYLEVIDKINSSLNNKRIIDFKVELNNIYIKLSDEETNYSMSISTPDSKTIIYQLQILKLLYIKLMKKENLTLLCMKTIPIKIIFLVRLKHFPIIILLFIQLINI